MRNYIKSRKADFSMLQVIISVILILLSTGLYFKFIVLTNSQITSESEDLVCRSYLSIKDFSGVKLGEFFYNLNYRCKKDFINEKVNTKKEVFNTIADAQKRCWYRFGEGEYDFMGNLNTNGFWCFECAQLDFSDSDLHKTYSYKEYVDYLKTINLTVDDEKKPYYDYINLKYANMADDKEMYEIKENIAEILQDGDKNFQDLGSILNQQYLYLADLQKKKISTDEKIYVVYRYDKPSNGFNDEMSTGVTTAIGTTVATIGAGMILEKAFWLVATGAVCTGGNAITAGAAMPLCALLATKTVGSAIEGIKTVKEKTGQFLKIKKISSFLKNSIKFSKTGEETVEIIAGKTDELEELAEAVSDIDAGAAQKLLNVQEKLRLNKIENLENIETLSEDALKNANKIDELFDTAYETMHSRELGELAVKQNNYMHEYENLIKLGDELKDAFKDIDKLNEAQKAELYSKKALFVKSSVALTMGIAAGVVNSQMNYNDYQYVDLLTEEQYYRLCGTKSFEESEFTPGGGDFGGGGGASGSWD